METPLVKTLLHAAIRNFEKTFHYDATYMHEVIDHAPAAAWKFGLIQIPAYYGKSLNRDAWHAAHLAGALSEDCGPCAQLSVDMALRDGVDPAKLAALVRGDADAAGAEAALAFRYGTAVAKNSPDVVELSAAIRRRFGERGLIAFAYAVTFARVYPTLKRALGHGQACAKIVVDHETIPVKLAA